MFLLCICFYAHSPHFLFSFGCDSEKQVSQVPILSRESSFFCMLHLFKVKRYRHISRTSRLAKAILGETAKGVKQEKKSKKWGDNTQEGSGHSFRASQKMAENGDTRSGASIVTCSYNQLRLQYRR